MQIQDMNTEKQFVYNTDVMTDKELWLDMKQINLFL